MSEDAFEALASALIPAIPLVLAAVGLCRDFLGSKGGK